MLNNSTQDGAGDPAPEKVYYKYKYKPLVIGLYIMIMYFAKEIMELLLRVVYGVDRRSMYVPVAQNVRAEMSYLANVRQYQRGELFYYVYHSIMSISLGILGFISADYLFED